MPIDGGKIVSYLELDASNYQKAMAKAEQEAQLFAHQLSAIGDSNLAVQQRINEFSSGMMNVGARMTLAISAPRQAPLPPGLPSATKAPLQAYAKRWTPRKQNMHSFRKACGKCPKKSRKARRPWLASWRLPDSWA